MAPVVFLRISDWPRIFDVTEIATRLFPIPPARPWSTAKRIPIMLLTTRSPSSIPPVGGSRNEILWGARRRGGPAASPRSAPWRIVGAESAFHPPPGRGFWRRGGPPKRAPRRRGGAVSPSAHTPKRTLGDERLRRDLCDSASRPIFSIRRAIGSAGPSPEGRRALVRDTGGPRGGSWGGQDLGIPTLYLQRCFFAWRNSEPTCGIPPIEPITGLLEERAVTDANFSPFGITGFLRRVVGVSKDPPPKIPTGVTRVDAGFTFRRARAGVRREVVPTYKRTQSGSAADAAQIARQAERRPLVIPPIFMASAVRGLRRLYSLLGAYRLNSARIYP